MKIATVLNVARIDTTRPMMVHASVTRNLATMPSHPMHDISVRMAQQTQNPAFLRMADPVEGSDFSGPAAPFLEWLLNESNCAAEFFEDLQCISETDKGEPLLTTWLSASRFSAMLEDGLGVAVIDELSARTKEWHALEMDEVYFDFYAIEESTLSTASS
jgi:hypothetical protein